MDNIYFHPFNKCKVVDYEFGVGVDLFVYVYIFKSHPQLMNEVSYELRNSIIS